MHDFAYLFPDSAASWLAGRGDSRFTRYERYYREARAAAPDKFDLESSNERYASLDSGRSNFVVALLNTAAFRSLFLFLVLLYGGSLVVPAMARMQPKATGALLVAGFVVMRIAHRRKRRAGRR